MRLLLAGLLLLPACDFISPVDCTTDLRPGIVLNLRESVTQQPVLTDTLTAIARDGSFADTVALEFASLTPIELVTLASENPGVYDVFVTARGYEPWSTTNVRVVEDDNGCHVVPVEIDVELEGER